MLMKVIHSSVVREISILGLFAIQNLLIDFPIVKENNPPKFPIKLDLLTKYRLRMKIQYRKVNYTDNLFSLSLSLIFILHS